MKSYYKNAHGELWHGDCLEVMDMLTMLGPQVDLVLCDPPYGTTACTWDSVIPFKKMWPMVWGCVKSRAAVVMTASQPFTSVLAASEMRRLKYEWIWEKSVAGDCMNAKNKPMKKHENILVFSTGTTANKSEKRMPYHPQGLRPANRQRCGVDYGATGGSFKTSRPSHGPYTQEVEGYPTSILKINNDRDKLHPTQKPVALFAYLIATYTDPGETVLDFCAGSGTTAVAAESIGRRWILVEKEEKYCEVIAKRLEGGKV